MSDFPALKTFDLSKRFRALSKLDDRKGYAVRDLNITVNKGDIYGFLGPNGSGKTTTIRMILGLVNPTKGTASVFGKDVRKERLEAVKMCGSMIDIPSFYPYLSARKNLEIIGGLYGGIEKQRIEETLDLVGLLSRADSKVRTFSHGMRQRLGFARAMMAHPRLLLLDEPTNGLDPEGNWEIIEVIKRLSEQEGISILLSSHLLSEIEQLCNRSCIVRRGKVLFEGEVSELISDQGIVEVHTSDNRKVSELLSERGFSVTDSSINADRIAVACDDGAALNELIISLGFSVSHLARRSRTLREVFLSYMNNASDGGKPEL